jgi:type II secretory pathway pseudopilin PulG
MRKGYSFIEAIVAIGIISALVVVALNVITASADTENINKDFLTAGMLAVESNELVLSLYKTNIRKFSEEYASTCGLVLPSFQGTADQCADTALKLNLDTNYLITQNLANGSLNIVQANTPFQNNQIFSEEFRLKLKQINGVEVYAYSEDQNDENTKYYRSVSLSAVDSGWAVLSQVGWVRTGGIPTIENKTLTIGYND